MIKFFCSRWAKAIVLIVVLASVISLALTFGKGGEDAQDKGKDYFTSALMPAKAVTGQTWIRNIEKTPMTCEQVCASKGSKLLVNGCYAKDANKKPKLCTMSSATKCIDYNSSSLVTNDYSTACCCEGTNFNGCTSTDGDNPFVKGTTSDGHYTTVTDKCNGNEIVDYKCDASGGVQSMNGYVCPNGCKDGACVKEPAPACTDSDGGKDYFVKGQTADFGDTREDVCFDSNTLTEFYCEQAAGQTRSSRGAEQKECEYGCEDGVCVEEPSEEDLERIETQKQIQELIAGTSGMNSMLNGVKVMENAFKQLVKQGIAMPSDLVETIARVKEISPEITKFQNKKAPDVTDEEAETLSDNLVEVCEIGSTLEEWGNQVPQFFQFGAQMKQMSKDLKKAQSAVKLAVKSAARSKYDIADKGDELNEAIAALKVSNDDAIASTNFDERDWKIDEFYDQFRDIYDTIGVINALQNTANAKLEWGRRVKDNVKTISAISKLEGAESGVEELTAKNDEVKAKVDELNVALVAKPLDRDEVKWDFEDLKILQSEFTDIADQLRGANSAIPKVQATKFNTSQFKNFTVFSQFCGVTEENDEEDDEELLF